MGKPLTASISAVIRAEMLRRGVTRSDLAAATGLSADTITNVVCGNNRTRRTRKLFEAAMGQTFWIDPTDCEESGQPQEVAA